MKHNLKVPVLTFNGTFFTEQVPQPDGPNKTRHVELKSILEGACLNADPQEFNTGDLKMQVYSLLQKIHAAEPYAELTAEDVTLLKRLAGKQLSVAATGAVFNALENPVTEPRKVEAMPDQIAGTPPQ